MAHKNHPLELYVVSLPNLDHQVRIAADFIFVAML